MSFVGRKRELQLLDDHLQWVRDGGRDHRGRALLLRGRRRVGKSRLVEMFVQQEAIASCYFAAARGTDPQTSRHELVRAIVDESTLPGRGAIAGLTPDSWLTAFRLLGDALPEDQPSIVVLDEFPWLTLDDPSVEGALQHAWDRYLSRKPVLLIIVGSDLSIMESLSDYGRPFHQRGSEMVLPALNPAEVAAMTKLPAADAFDAYLITGGLPLVCQDWNANTTPSQFLKRSFADPTSALLVSGERSLAAEFPPDARARQVLTTIGGQGERTFTSIAQSLGGAHALPAATVNSALKLLIDKRLVQFDEPLCLRAATKDKRYRIADPYLRFWLSFVDEALPTIERGRGDIALRRWQTSWESWRGRAIEPVVRDALARLLPNDDWPTATEIGGWWPRNNVPEIDLVGADRRPARNIAFCGSIKWHTKGLFDDRDFQQLARDAMAVPGADRATPLVAVSRTPIAAEGLAATWQPEDLLAAWDC